MEIKEVLQLYDYLNDMKEEETDIYEQLKEIEERFDRFEYYLNEILEKVE